MKEAGSIQMEVTKDKGLTPPHTQKNKKTKTKITICVCFIFAIILAAVAFVCYRVIKHEQKQNARLSVLEESVSKMDAKVSSIMTGDNARITALEEKVKALKAELSSITTDHKWLDDGYNYLAIGNSITLHGLASYWWNEVGMAASDINHDYYHIVSSYLQTTNDKFMGEPCNFYIWETQSHDRDETLQYLDRYLSPKLDLITIQLGENASDLTTYEEDYESLINYIKEKAPNARLLVIGDFWTRENRNDLKIMAVDAKNVEFVSLEGIADNSDYYCGIGAVVLGEDGKKHIVEHSGVAIHPGDSGMKAIAERIILALKMKK